MRSLRLRFGALDLIVTPDEQVWFLEVNPNGQWAFIEDATGLPITASISDALQKDTDAFRHVPRHPFVPRVFRRNQAGEYEALDSSSPDWLSMVYSDAVLTTQLNGDDALWARAHITPVTGTPTSSSSQPSLMARMLEVLDVAEGHLVLEIGTGTGYNAAILSHRLASDQVTTIEVDPHLCRQAETVLQRCGYNPTLVCGDGTILHETGATYDRIIATCSTPAIPTAWISQMRPGGLILASLYRPLGGGPLLRLTVTGDRTAEGRFLPGGGGFMPTRDQADIETMPLFKTAVSRKADATRRTTTVGAEMLHHRDFGMLAGLTLPDVTTIGFTPAGGNSQQWLLSSQGDWACLDAIDGEVTEYGTRRLWNEVETIYHAWKEAGNPARDKVGLTVTPDWQWVWLGTPDQPLEYTENSDTSPK